MSEIILIIDDDLPIREAMAEVLTLEGYQVVTASDGRDAFLKLINESVRPDLIIADFLMPNMDGAEFRRRQLETASLAPIPIFFTSAMSGEISELQGCTILKKPFDLEEFLEVVNANLSSKERLKEQSKLPEVMV